MVAKSALTLCDLMAVLGRSASTFAVPSGSCDDFNGEGELSSPLELIAARWDFEVRSPAGRRRAVGES